MNTTVYNIVAKNNKTKESVITANATGWKAVLDALENIIYSKSSEGWRSYTVNTFTYPRYIFNGRTFATSVTLVKYGEKRGEYDSYFLYIKKA